MPVGGQAPVAKRVTTHPGNSIIMGNIAGLMPQKKRYKTGFIKEMAIERNSQLISLTESHLNEEILDAEINIDGFNIFRADRTQTTKGGVIVYIKKEIAASAKILKSGSIGLIEYICIYLLEFNLMIITMYRSPDSNSENLRIAIKEIEEAISSIAPVYPTILLNGDFNYPHLRFRQGIVENIISSASGSGTLINFVNKHHLIQLIDKPTRNDNILDLMFTNDEELLTGFETHITKELSDHLLITADTIICPKNQIISEETINLNSLGGLNFLSDKTEWDKINQELKDANYEDVYNESNMDDRFEKLNQIILSICKKYVPARKNKKKKHQIPLDRRILMNKRQKLEDKLAISWRENTIQETKTSLEDIERKLSISLKTEKKTDEGKAISVIASNSKYFYYYARKNAKLKPEIGPFEINGVITHDPKQKAEILKNQFESVFVPLNEEESWSDSPPQVNECYLEDITFTEDDIVKKIMEVRKTAAAGIDDFPAVLLKNCADALKVPLYKLWRDSLDLGQIATVHKIGIITPIYKGESRGNPKNYRPVSLTSHLIKIFEKIIGNKLMEFLEKNDKLNRNQHGFRCGRSCLSQLIEHQNRVLEGLENNEDVEVVYLDFAKAFDKVHHGILLQKLRTVGITGKLYDWIKNFLSNRKQSVSVEGCMSSESNVTSGVPQGSVLGPILFLVHISDIDKGTHHCKVSSFADDTRIMKSIKDDSDRTLLQNDLNSIYQWANESKMKFNADKFEMMRYQLRQSEEGSPNYTTTDGQSIEQKKSVKDLGIIMADSANFSENIALVARKAKSRASWILRTFQSRDELLMKTLLKALIYPIAEYCCQLWNPHMKYEIRNLEDSQRYFTRMIDGMQKKSYWERLKLLKLYSLERRRERYIIIYTWKLLNDKIPNIEGEKGIKKKFSERKGTECQIPPMKSTRVMQRVQSMIDNSLVVKGPKLFNKLPRDLRDFSGNLEGFKKRLDDFLVNIPDQPVLPTAEYAQSVTSNSLLEKIRLPR